MNIFSAFFLHFLFFLKSSIINFWSLLFDRSMPSVHKFQTFISRLIDSIIDHWSLLFNFYFMHAETLLHFSKMFVHQISSAVSIWISELKFLQWISGIASFIINVQKQDRRLESNHRINVISILLSAVTDRDAKIIVDRNKINILRILFVNLMLTAEFWLEAQTHWRKIVRSLSRYHSCWNDQTII